MNAVNDDTKCEYAAEEDRRIENLPAGELAAYKLISSKQTLIILSFIDDTNHFHNKNYYFV